MRKLACGFRESHYIAQGEYGGGICEDCLDDAALDAV